MKFKISGIRQRSRLLPSSINHDKLKAIRFRARRGIYYRTAAVKRAAREQERIKFSALFEFAELDAPQIPKKHRARNAVKATSRALSSLGSFFKKLFTTVGRAVISLIKRLAPLSRPRSISMLFGAFCAALTVTLISALLIGAHLLSGYFLPYEQFVIPDLIGHQLDEATELCDGYADLSVSYVHSTKYPSGTIISQYPSGGIIKKQYANTSPSPISLKVSLGTKEYRVDDMSGKSARDALITLRENEVITKIVTEYSDTLPKGHVISTLPSANAIVSEGETLTLRVSLGKKIKTVSVPDLYNLTESGACLTITDRGLSVGSISYVASTLPAGRVISQSPAPFEQVREGEQISFAVSAGDKFDSHLVPDLYGMTLEQAKQKLREVGIVVGNIYSVSSGAPSGTVIAQSPIPSSPIVSSITSVDLYISS